MDKKTRKAITTAKRYIRYLRRNKIRIDQAYLFGSYVYGIPHDGSDIDVAVVSRQFSTRSIKDGVRLALLGRDVDNRISALPYHPKDFTDEHLIPHEAMTKGIRIA